MALTFTLPVLSLYGEGEAQPVNGETTAAKELTVLVEHLDSE